MKYSEIYKAWRDNPIEFWKKNPTYFCKRHPTVASNKKIAKRIYNYLKDKNIL